MDESKYKPLSDFDYVTYLIGAMQFTAAGDGGSSMREKFEEGLLARNVFAINPTKSEALRTGMSTLALTEKRKGWVASGHWDLFRETSQHIWKGRHLVSADGDLLYVPGDFHYVKISSWLTAIVNKNDRPCGTHAEAGLAMDLGIPIYLITDMAKRELPQSFLDFVVGSGGETFGNANEYFDYIDATYKLKVK